MKAAEILNYLKEHPLPERRKSYDYFGIETGQALGLSMPQIRAAAKHFGKNQERAEALWEADLHEAKLLAVLTAEPTEIGMAVADKWVNELYSWDVCDHLCADLLAKTDYGWDLPFRYAPSEKEFVRRAGLVMIVGLRLRHKKVSEKRFIAYFPLLLEYASDDRNFVKKAVSWAIRELGKRSAAHHAIMLNLCEQLLEKPHKCAHWIARDALRELESARVLQRIAKIAG